MQLQPLANGDIVDVIAPASKCSKDELEQGLQMLRGLGLLEALSRRGACRTRDLQAATGLTGPTIVRMMETLIAAGYENGAALLCRPDSAEILFLRAAGGGAVTTLAWSADGAFLALGAAVGEIGVVAFPERLFRPVPEANPAEPRKSAP